MHQNVSWREIRDCLHEALTESRNKTSRACQRRVVTMMRNQKVFYHVKIAFEELKQHPSIVEISGGGPITQEERAKGPESIEKLVNTRYIALLIIYVFILFVNNY